MKTTILKNPKINVIDLFAGAGGLSIGATWAGANVAASVELDSTACETLRANPAYHGLILEQDICDLSGEELLRKCGLTPLDSVIVVGGPPCQPFSKAAYWTDPGEEAAYRRARSQGLQAVRPLANQIAKPDARRSLVDEFWRIILEVNADGFVFENVPSIKHPRNKHVYDDFVKRAEDFGFHLTELVANAAQYGVPQVRERVIVLGSRTCKPTHPPVTHSKEPNAGLLPFVTSGEALKPFRAKRYSEPEELVVGRWARHLEEVPPGWNYKAHTAWAGHPNPTFITETRFWNFLLKLSPDKPSWTLAASPGPWTGPFHWSGRRLRTPELAALQGFPSDYVICGGRRERVRQLGNAVPAPLAKVMIRSVIRTLGHK